MSNNAASTKTAADVNALRAAFLAAAAKLNGLPTWASEAERVEARKAWDAAREAWSEAKGAPRVERPDTFTGSYRAAVAHFGGPVRHAGGGTGTGSPTRWTRV